MTLNSNNYDFELASGKVMKKLAKDAMLAEKISNLLKLCCYYPLLNRLYFGEQNSLH
jgi:hypothetical protein